MHLPTVYPTDMYTCTHVWVFVNMPIVDPAKL